MVRAATATDTYRLDRLDFLELYEREPNLNEVFSRTIAERRAAVAQATRASAAV
jgi:CRP-like cAMP-binding protein